MGPPTISICVCTRNRPENLRTCLASVEAGDELPEEIIVSDDSDQGSETQDVCREFPFASYVRGPCRGLSANRNTAIRAATGDYISFLDDDANVSDDFVRTSRRILAQAAPDTVFTGRVIWNGVLIEMVGSRTFLGHFGSTPRGAVENLVIACSNLFPASAFKKLSFDEAIEFGYEEMDMADQLLSAGFRIEYRPELLNYHQTPEMTPQERRLRDEPATRTRFYASIKHHLRHGRRTMVPLYVVVASVHEAAHRVRSREGAPALGAFADMWWAVTRARRAHRAEYRPALARRV
jgi:GT2 family glycosyltransferase